MNKILKLLIILLVPISLQAQNDVKGSSDHPLISRYEGFRIIKYQEVEFDKFPLPVGPAVDRKTLGKTLNIEGKITKITYQLVAEPHPSILQVVKNYEQAFQTRGAELLYSCLKEECGKNTDIVIAMAENQLVLNDFIRFGVHAYYAYKFSYEAKDYYTGILFREEKNQIMYELHVIEIDVMATDKVSLASIEESINENGKMAFYGINFDFGTAKLREDAYPTLELISEFLKKQSERNFFIVGHTDYVGSYSNNLTLSKDRAQAVYDALINKYGASASQLTAIGVGPVAPMANNQTDAGRARNRRVELVLGSE